MREDIPLERFWDWRWGSWAVFAVLAVLAMLLYAPVYGTGLLSDDWGLSDPAAPPWSSLHGHWFGGGEGSFYRPLSRIAIFIEARVFGFGGAVQHVLSVLLHLGCAFWIFWGFNRIKSPGAGLIAAAFGIFHPAAVETVGWISSQTDLFVMFFFAGAFALAFARPTVVTVIASFVFALFGYLSKETAIVLGPSLVFAAVYAFLFFRENTQLRKLMLIAGGGHLLLWLVYMLARKIFLGQFLIDSASEVTLGQISASFLASFHELLKPVYDFAAQRRPLDGRETGIWPVLVGLPLLAVVLGALCRHAAAVAVLLLFVSMLPFARQMEISYITAGNLRYLYHPLWVFAVVAGIALQPLVRHFFRRPGAVLAFVVMLIVLMRFCFWTTIGLSDFERAAEVREAIEEEMRRELEGTRNALIVVSSAPDRIGGAFVFRNGFDTFARVLFPDEAAVVKNQITREDLRPGIPVFRLQYRDEGLRPYFVKDEALMQKAGELQDQQAGPPAPPFNIDFGNQRLDFSNLPHSTDVEVAGRIVPEAFSYQLTGNDPHIAIPYPQDFVPSKYSTLTLVIDFADAPPDGEETDTIEVIFMSADTESVPVTVGKPVDLKPGQQEIVFDLSENLDWSITRQLQWFRFDPSTEYRGRLDMYRLELE